MKILYDHQIFEDQKIGGISRYFVELINYNPTAKLSMKYSNNVYLQSNKSKKIKIISPQKYYDNFIIPYNFKGKGRLFQYYNNKLHLNQPELSIKYLKKSNFDVFHPTYYDPYFLNYIKNKPFILTVHDMIYELFPQYFIYDNNTITNKKTLILAANKIIAISENTKKDIIKYFPETKNKITVIYHGSSFLQLERNSPKENYILFTGARGGYKNFNAFLQAVTPLLIKHDFNLICTGISFDDQENKLINNLQIKDRISCVFASESQLVELYSKATAFIFPSLYEGFGIPILEAFTSNCPAVLSNTSSLPEVGGDAAIYFDPNSIDDMRTQIERVITSTTLQNELIKKGKEQAKKFSWEKCAKETMEVYKQLKNND
jgi:glycosyltransferase involved in cell wall biosynthesis